jgi:hypothetical protein
LLVHHILISSSTCHVVLLTELLQYNNCSLASNMQDILTLAPQFSTNLRPAEHIPCSHRICTVNTTTTCTVAFLTNTAPPPHVTVDQSIHTLSNE